MASRQRRWTSSNYRPFNMPSSEVHVGVSHFTLHPQHLLAHSHTFSRESHWATNTPSLPNAPPRGGYVCDRTRPFAVLCHVCAHLPFHTHSVCKYLSTLVSLKIYLNINTAYFLPYASSFNSPSFPHLPPTLSNPFLPLHLPPSHPCLLPPPPEGAPAASAASLPTQVRAHAR